MRLKWWEDLERLKQRAKIEKHPGLKAADEKRSLIQLDRAQVLRRTRAFLARSVARASDKSVPIRSGPFLGGT